MKDAIVTKLEYMGQDSTRQSVFRGWTGRTQKLFRTKYNPNYFFVLESELTAIQGLLDNTEVDVEHGDYAYVFGHKPAVKLTFENPKALKDCRDVLVRDAFSALEYVDPERRTRIDHSCKVPNIADIDIASVDIEVDARAGFPRHDNPVQRILGIAIVGSDGYEDFITADNETLIYTETKKKLSHYRLVTGWNIDGFDKPYLMARAKLLGFEWHIPGVSWVDALKLYRGTEYGRGVSCRLDDTAKRELNREIKKEFEMLKRMQALWDSFVAKDGKLKNYCLDDARACFDIVVSEKLQLLDRYVVPIANIASTDYEDTMFPSRVVESVVLKEALEHTPRLIFPSEHSFNKDSESFEGGKVIDPKPGLWNFVVAFDFQSLYNRSMQTWNIGLDSFIDPTERVVDGDYIRAPNGAFYTKIPSVYRTVLRKLEVTRNFYRTLEPGSSEQKRMYYVLQNAYKIVILEVWGVLGLSSSRLFSRPIAESIAAVGRWALTAAEEFFKKEGCKIIYGDTDSIFVQYPAITDIMMLINTIIPASIEKANAYIKQQTLLQFNMPEDFYCLNLEFRELYDKYYIPTKKRYIGRIVYEKYPCNKIFTRGFEIARFSAFDLFKEVQKEVFNIIFKHDDIKDAVKETEKYVQNIKTELFARRLDAKLVLRSGVHALPSAYVVDQPYVTAAKKLVAAGLFRVGDIVKYVITRNNKDGLDAEPIISDMPKITSTGYAYYWDRISTFKNDILETKGGLANIKLDKFCEVSS